MKHFKYQAPGSYEEAGQILENAQPGQAAAVAGGTDLLGVLKGEILENIFKGMTREAPNYAVVEDFLNNYFIRSVAANTAINKML